jgi:capsular polysaccharide transport system permease protein
MSTETIADPPRRTRSAWEIQRAVLFALALRELRTRAGRRWAGVVWTLVEPMAQVALILLIFGFLRQVASPGMEFPIFLTSGLMPYILFRNLAQRLTESIDTNRGLFSYRQVKPFDAVVARGIVETVLWAAVFVLTLALLAWLGYTVLPERPLELFEICGVVMVLGGGVGLLVAVATHGLPKTRSLIQMLYFPLYFASGVIFAIDRVPATYQQWLLWNPVLHAVELSRSAFSASHHPIQGIGIGYPAAFTLVVLALGLMLYRRDRQKLLLGD